MTARNSLGVVLGKHVAPPRFLAFLVLLVLGWFAHRAAFPDSERAESGLLAFDLAATVFLVSLVPLLRRRGAEAIRTRADANDANRLLVLAVTTLLTITVMAAISSELAGAEQGDVAATVKLIISLMMIWLFANSVYALHYAHVYYASAPGGAIAAGLISPAKRNPITPISFIFRLPWA